MPANNLPEEIVRLLSLHGPVEVWTGRGDRATTSKVTVAPFDDELILLVPRRSPLLDGLLQTSATAVTAKRADQSYSLNLVGRAVAGRPVTSHPNRGSITPWLPEGAEPRSFIAVPFVAESVEMLRQEGHVRNRYAGPTPAGAAKQGAVRRVVTIALGGGGRWVTITSLVGSFLWYGYQGAGYPYRPLAVLLAWVACLGLIGGTRLVGMAAAFRLWRVGQGNQDGLSGLCEGLLAPEQARSIGAVALLFATMALGGVAMFPRGSQGVLVVLLSTGFPILAAAWLLR
ncbi:MAG: hypothetical protein GXP62_20130, partial [Oligoflexia bacterium]|nr:hypothetical protein [Oligoflexia bacterium]